MNLSEYTLTEGSGLIMDPLGFLRPYSALQDILFPQFTVLSNHPAYHGFLALAYTILEKQGLTPREQDFSRAFRRLEIPWGMMNLWAGEKIVNVTKYQQLDVREKLVVGDIPSGHPLFYRLNYGTLGHYSSPSVSWGFLEKGGLKLTPMGRALAQAFGRRGTHNLETWLSDWFNGEKTLRKTDDTVIDMAQRYCLKAEPKEEEKQIWQQAIERHHQRVSMTKVYWDEPLSAAELSTMKNDPLTYDAFFPTLEGRYRDLAHVLRLWKLFEKISALIQTIFEREYHARGAQDGKTQVIDPKQIGDTEARVSECLHRHITEYFSLPEHPDTGVPHFVRLKEISNYKEQSGVIVDHHKRHQKVKGVLPFIDDDKVLVLDKLDRKGFSELWGRLGGLNTQEIEREIVFRYKRDWHFERVALYSDYAGRQS